MKLARRIKDELRLRRRLTLAVVVAVTLCSRAPARLAAQRPSAPTEDSLAPVHHAIDSADWNAAERELRLTLAAHADAAEPSFLLGYVLFRQQRAADSLAAYTAAARLRTPTPAELIVVASDYILLKDYADAERWLLSATKQSPENPTAWYLLGRSQYNLDHAADAVASLQRCLVLSPKDVRAEYNLGLTLEKLNRVEDAQAAYQTAIQWQKDTGARDPQPYLDLGMLLLAQRQAEQALPVLQEAVSVDARNALAQQELGLAFEALGRPAEAVAPLQRAAELAPDAERPHFFLGRVYRRLGRVAESTAQFAQAKRVAGTRSERETPNYPHSSAPLD